MIGTFDNKTQTYSLSRLCGLFSNIDVAILDLMELFLKGIEPKTISFTLQQYKKNYNIYDDLFFITPNNLHLGRKVVEETFNAISPAKAPFGFNIKDRVLLYKHADVIYRFLRKYFFVNSIVQNHLVDDLTTINNIRYDNTIFIWGRRTDKVVENSVPQWGDYNVLVKNSPYQVVLQTDDMEIADGFQKDAEQVNNFSLLKVLPIYTKQKPRNISLYGVDDHVFLAKYGMAKIEYLQKLLALWVIMCKCKYAICYPGSMTYPTLAMRKRKMDRSCVLFYDHNTTFEIY